MRKKFFRWKKHSSDINTLKEQQAAEINTYQAKYKDLLEKLEQKAEQPTKKTTTTARKSTTDSKKNKQTTKK